MFDLLGSVVAILDWLFGDDTSDAANIVWAE